MPVGDPHSDLRAVAGVGVERVATRVAPVEPVGDIAPVVPLGFRGERAGEQLVRGAGRGPGTEPQVCVVGPAVLGVAVGAVAVKMGHASAPYWPAAPPLAGAGPGRRADAPESAAPGPSPLRILPWVRSLCPQRSSCRRSRVITDLPAGLPDRYRFGKRLFLKLPVQALGPRTEKFERNSHEVQAQPVASPSSLGHEGRSGRRVGCTRPTHPRLARPQLRKCPPGGTTRGVHRAPASTPCVAWPRDGAK